MRIGIGTLALLVTSMQLMYAAPVEGQSISQTKVSMELKHESLIQAFQKIEAQTNYHFMYRYDEVKNIRDLNIPVGEQSIASFLKTLLQNTSLTFRQVDDQILIAPKQLKSGSNAGNETVEDAQNAPKSVIKGRVTNDKGEPLAGVSVTVKENSTGTSTDVNGNFSINAPDNGGTLVFTYIDFVTREVSIGGQTTINVTMQPADKALNEVIVTALGISRSVKSLTYSAQTIKTGQLNEAKETNFINSLQGKVAGLTITRDATGPGGESKVLLRGNRSISGVNDPLYIIDGVPLAGGIEMLNSDDVESMTVLKGASAAALYGSQGQNGAIIITTRKGRSGGLRVDYNGGIALDQASVLPELQYQYGQGDAGMFVSNSEHSWGPKADGQIVTLWNGDQVPLRGQPNRMKDFFRTAATITNSVSVSGGTDKIQGYFSYGNTLAQGIMPNNDLHRHNIDFKLNYDISPKLSFMTKLSYIYEDVDNRVTPGEGGTYALPSLFRSPTSIPLSEMKKYSTLDASGVEHQSYWKPGSSILENPYWALNRVLYYQQKDRIIGLFAAKYKFNSWLDLQVRGSIDKTFGQTDNKIYADNYFSLVGSDYNYGLTRNQSTNIDVLFSFKHDIGKNFNLSGNFGGSNQSGNSFNDAQSANGLAKPNFFYMSNAKAPYIMDTYAKSPQVLSVYATATLKYKSFLFLDVTGRNDWSSALPVQNQSYFYPSVGISDVVSDMLRLPDWVTYGKVRVTYAQSGNGGNSYLDRNYFNVQPGYIVVPPTVRGLGNYKPELTSSYEAGLEWSFLKDRVGFDLTYYSTDSKNQLLQIAVPAGTLFTTSYINAGLIRNRGVELVLHATPIKLKDFSWDLTLNYAKNVNKVVELANGLPFVVLNNDREAQTRAAVGGSFGDMYVKDWARDPTTGKRLVDATGTPILTAQNTVYLGNYNPNYTTGLGNSFTYKNLSLNFLIDYQNGGYIIAGTQALIDADGHSKNSLRGREGGIVLDAVTADGKQNTQVISSQAYFGVIGDRYPTGGLYAYSATNMRLRELALGYRLPRKWIGENKFVKDVKFSIVGRNLFFIIRKAPIDPEISENVSGITGGLEYGAMPSTRNYGLNIKVSF